MSDAQGYYDGLIGQGYTPAQATEYTEQYYPGFQPTAPQVAPVSQFVVDQAQVQQVAQQHGVDANQLVETARHFDANADGILKESELQATAQQMTSTATPTAPVAAAPAATPMAAAPAMGGAPPMGAAPMGGMAAPMMGGAPMGGMMPAPAAASGGGPLGYVAIALIVVTLVFSTWGVLGGTWLLPSEDTADDMPDYMDVRASLNSVHMAMDTSDDMYGDLSCDEVLDGAIEGGDWDKDDVECDGDILTMTMSWSDAYDECQKALDDDSTTEEEDDCEENNEMASAGTWGGITLWVSVAAGLGAALLIVFNVFGIGALPVDTQKFGMIVGIAAGALAGIGVLLWYLLLPDSDDFVAGLNVWLTITGAVTGIVAGVLVKVNGKASA